jgi:hypothetical protein
MLNYFAVFQIACLLLWIFVRSGKNRASRIARKVSLFCSILFIAYTGQIFLPVPISHKQAYSLVLVLFSFVISLLIAFFELRAAGLKSEYFIAFRVGRGRLIAYLILLIILIGFRYLGVFILHDTFRARIELFPIILVLALNEEIYFRYYLDDKLVGISMLSNPGRRALAISVFFASLHLLYPGAFAMPGSTIILQFIGRITASLVFIAIKRGMRHIVYPTFAHAVLNLMSL